MAQINLGKVVGAEGGGSYGVDIPFNKEAIFVPSVLMGFSKAPDGLYRVEAQFPDDLDENTIIELDLSFDTNFPILFGELGISGKFVEKMQLDLRSRTDCKNFADELGVAPTPKIKAALRRISSAFGDRDSSEGFGWSDYLLEASYVMNKSVDMAWLVALIWLDEPFSLSFDEYHDYGGGLEENFERGLYLVISRDFHFGVHGSGNGWEIFKSVGFKSNDGTIIIDRHDVTTKVALESIRIIKVAPPQ